MVSPAKKLTLHEDILNQMLEAIKNGEFSSGEKLPREVDLAQQFQVSRNCIREAMKTLGWLDIVESISGQGTFIKENAQNRIRITELLKDMNKPSSFLELMETRMFLETSIAFFAAMRATDEDIEKLQSIIETGDARMEETNSVDLASAREFHEALAEIAGNKLMMKLLDSIRAEIDAQRSNYEAIPTYEWKDMLHCHKQILRHIIDKEPEKAFNTMYEDLLQSMVVLKKEPDKQ